ncbi:hypothetical protein QKQ25_gp027 [Hyphantria cunea granulovirus]|uniref:Uncharacterized protein n=1 Tax=Hyphantria cunea granulovirus TaxID=307448 RepID=A0AAF1D259_9BBAC|nr:hypothetical protein QKQ25_gp027 [Hyphantria cunea granulovirus]QBQ01580.1 hypothetical protein HycuGV_00027 [Hyphantria cunea granulovirus]
MHNFSKLVLIHYYSYTITNPSYIINKIIQEYLYDEYKDRKSFMDRRRAVTKSLLKKQCTYTASMQRLDYIEEFSNALLHYCKTFELPAQEINPNVLCVIHQVLRQKQAQDVDVEYMNTVFDSHNVPQLDIDNLLATDLNINHLFGHMYTLADTLNPYKHFYVGFYYIFGVAVYLNYLLRTRCCSKQILIKTAQQVFKHNIPNFYSDYEILFHNLRKTLDTQFTEVVKQHVDIYYTALRGKQVSFHGFPTDEFIKWTRNTYVENKDFVESLMRNNTVAAFDFLCIGDNELKCEIEYVSKQIRKMLALRPMQQ